MPTVGSLKVLIEGDMKPYLVSIRQADEATKGLTGVLRRALPDALSTSARAAGTAERGLAGFAAQTLAAARGVQALAAAWAGSQIVRGISDFARTAHEAQAGAIVFERMLERVGESARDVEPELERLAETLKVPAQVIRSNAAELLRAGYQWEQIAAIYQGAGASALLAGKSTAQGVEIATSALVSGLSTYLNQIGIVQNLSTAYTQYARELGKTTEELTEAERAQAATLMITRATGQEVQDLPLLLQGYGGAVSDLNEAWYQFKVVVGTAVLPAVTAVMLGLTGLLGPIGSVVSWLTSLGRSQEQATDESYQAYRRAIDQARAYTDLADQVDALIGRYRALSGLPQRTAGEETELAEVTARLNELLPAQAKGIGDLADALKDPAAISAIGDWTAGLRAMGEAAILAEAANAFQRIRGEQEEQARLQEQLNALQAKYGNKLSEIATLQDRLGRAQRELAIAEARFRETGVADVEALRRVLREQVPSLAPWLGDAARVMEIARTMVQGFAAQVQTQTQAFADAQSQVDALQRALESIGEAIARDTYLIEQFRRAAQGLPILPPPQPSVPAGAEPGATTMEPLLLRVAAPRAMAAYTARLEAIAESYLEQERIERLKMLRGIEAYTARLHSQAAVYLEQERIERLKMLRGMDAYAARLAGQALEYEYAQRIADQRAMAAYAARLQAQADVYLEQERLERLRMARGMSAYTDRLQAQALDEEYRQRVGTLRAMAAYTARLEAQAVVYLEQERLERLKAQRGLTAYAERLQAQALEAERQQRVATQRAMAVYTERLEAQAAIYLEQERTERLKMMRGMAAYAARLEAMALDQEYRERTVMLRSMAAYASRLQAQAEVYIEQERIERLRVARGLQAYTERLQAQALDYEYQQRVKMSQAMAAYAARLDAMAAIYLEEERIQRLRVVRGFQVYGERLSAQALEYEAAERTKTLRAMAAYAARLDALASVYLEQERTERLKMQRGMSAYGERLTAQALDEEYRQRVSMQRAMAAYSARLEALAAPYMEQERTERLKMQRGMQAYAERLQAQALDYEYQQRVQMARAMAAYAARLEGQAKTFRAWQEVQEVAADEIESLIASVRGLDAAIRGWQTGQRLQEPLANLGASMGGDLGAFVSALAVAAPALGALAAVAAESEGVRDALSSLETGIRALADVIGEALLAIRSTLQSVLGPRFGGAVYGALSGAAMGALVGSVIPGIGTIAGAITGGILGAIGGWITGAAEDDRRAAEMIREAAETMRAVSERWHEWVGEAPMWELVSQPIEVPAELIAQRDEIQAAIEEIEQWGVWPWERERYEQLKETLREINEEIARWEEDAVAALDERLREMLGITWRSLADAVRGAFDAEDLATFTDDVGRALRLKVRDALITAFLESAAMAPLFEALSDAIMNAVQDGVLEAGELASIEGIIGQITTNSEAFFQVLDELGLSMSDLSEATRSATEAMRNVPSGFKYIYARVQATTPEAAWTMPTPPGVGQIGGGKIQPQPVEREPVTIVVEIQGDVYGMDDFDRRVQRAVDEAVRRRGMAAYGMARA